jgi:hypothetical protein
LEKHIKYLNEKMSPFNFEAFNFHGLNNILDNCKDKNNNFLVYSNYAISPGNISCMLFIEDCPLMFGGIRPLYPGVGETFGIIGDTIKNDLISYDINGPDFTLTIGRIIDYFAKELCLHRIKCIHPANNSNIKLRWLKAIGLEEEGTMKQYFSDKKDAILLSKIYE